MGVKVEVKVSMGQLTMSLGDLMKAHKGQVFSLDSKLQEPVELSVEGHVVALGLLVAVGDHFGVQITQLKKAT